MSNNTEQSLWEPPEVTIAGETYEMRRLGIKDLKSLWNIIQTALGQGLDKEKIKKLQEDEDSVEDVGMEVMISIVPMVTDKVSQWCVSVLENGDEIDIEDPNQFPVQAPLKIINVLGGEHEDFKAFFMEAGQAKQIISKVTKNLGLTQSTPSDNEDGQNEKS